MVRKEGVGCGTGNGSGEIVTTWLKLLWWLLAALCLELWTACLKVGFKVLHGYRRRKLRQRDWDCLMPVSEPARQSGNRVRVRGGLGRRRPTRGKRTAVLVGIWFLATVTWFLNVWVVTTALLVVGVPVFWLAWRFVRWVGYALAGRAYIRELEAGDTW